jgi:hypothetical protein
MFNLKNGSKNNDSKAPLGKQEDVDYFDERNMLNESAAYFDIE